MNEKEQFKALAVDMKPVVAQMEEILKKHGIDCLATLTLNTDGYITFSHHNTDWEMNRSKTDGLMRISNTFVEEI